MRSRFVEQVQNFGRLDLGDFAAGIAPRGQLVFYCMCQIRDFRAPNDARRPLERMSEAQGARDHSGPVRASLELEHGLREPCNELAGLDAKVLVQIGRHWLLLPCQCGVPDTCSNAGHDVGDVDHGADARVGLRDLRDVWTLVRGVSVCVKARFWELQVSINCWDCKCQRLVDFAHE